MADPADELAALEQEIIDHLFALSPAYAVGLGLHDYDGRTPDLSTAATDRWSTEADRLLTRLAEVDADDLAPDRRIDQVVLRLLMESPLFDLREAHELERNPMAYTAMFSLTNYLAREYAPSSERLAAVARILAAAPGVFETGRRRLRGPLPKPFVELAIQMGGSLPLHFAEAEAYAARSGAAGTLSGPRAAAQTAVREFVDWLQTDELPRATAPFALGPERYRRLLYVREGIEAPVDELRAAGAADLHRNQARLAEIARTAGRSETELIAALADDHPSAEQILPTARAFVEETQRFVREKDLVTIPEPAVCRVEETPPDSRAWTTASMNPPGPFDTKTPDGIYFVTLVDPSWSAEQQQQWLRTQNRPLLRNITVHEVYPGHYLHALHIRARPAPLARKVYNSPSFVEGWAHYAEQLAIEAGLGSGGYEAEVAQIHDALLRDCRLLSSIGLHTEGWTVERSTELFRSSALFEQLPAQREAMRGTFNPEYFCYTLGKLAILDARKKYLASRFGGSLRAFHDALLSYGSPPVGLIDAVLERAAAAA